MRFLADESCDFRVVKALRAAGHDVKAVIEVSPGADDVSIIEMAGREQRIFVTEDRDFGQLMFASGKPTIGIMLLRYPSAARSRLPDVLVDIVGEYGEKLAGRFAVIQPGRIRFGV